MRITTKAVYDIESGKLLDWHGYEYGGPLEMAGGGPDKQQRGAEDADINLANQAGQLASQRSARQTQFENQVLPFYTSRMNGGLPFMKAATDYTGGQTAQAYAPARAALQRRISSSTGLPSGYANQALTDFDTNEAQGFDSNLLNLMNEDEQAREYGASGISSLAASQNPQSYFGTAGQLNQSVLNAPRRPGIAGVLGGIVGAGAQTAASFA